MPSKLTISNNPHVYHRKKHFRRRQSHQPKLQKEEDQQIEEQQIHYEDSFYYKQYQELQRKENIVKKAQNSLLKLASQENYEEEVKQDWSNLQTVSKHKINFLKQLGNYMEECTLNNDKIFFDDMQQNINKPVKQNQQINKRQGRGISVDGNYNLIDKRKYYSSPKKLDIYDKKVSINMVKDSIVKMDQDGVYYKKFQKDNSDLLQKYQQEDRNYQQQLEIDPKKCYQQKKSLNQYNITSANPYIISSEKIVISHSKQHKDQSQKIIQIQDQKDSNSSTRFDSNSRKRNINYTYENNNKYSSTSNIGSGSLEDFAEFKLENDQDCDTQRFTPLSLERKKQNESAKKNQNQKDKCQNNDETNSNSTLFNLQKIKQIDNIMKLKPFVISMLQTSTMLNNKSDLSFQEKRIQKEEYKSQNENRRSCNNQFYLRTNQSDDCSTTLINNNKTISNFNLVETEECRDPTEKRKIVFSSEKKQKTERPKTSSIHYQYQREQNYESKVNQQNKEKLLNIINNTNQQSLLQNQFGGIIINHPLFKQQNNLLPPTDNSKENNNDCDLFINKDILQNKNKFKIMLACKGVQQQNPCNSTRSYENSQRFNGRQTQYQSYMQNTNPVKASSRNSQDPDDRNTSKIFLKNNKAVAIGKAKNLILSKNVNNSLNNSFINGNYQSYNNNNNNKNNNNLYESYYDHKSLYNQQQLLTERNNFIGYQVFISDKQNNNIK